MQKKAKRRMEEEQDYKDSLSEQFQQRVDQKRARMQEIKKEHQERL